MNIKNDLMKIRTCWGKRGFSYSFIKKQIEKKQKFIGNSAVDDLTTIIYGYIVGYKELYQPFLARTINWLQKGIDNVEKMGESLFYHQFNLNYSFALACWLNGEQNNIASWCNATAWLDKGDIDYDHLSCLADKEFFALELLVYIQAKQYEKAIGLFKQVTKNKPFNLNNNMSGFRVAYAYCLHFYENKFTVQQIEKASRLFLVKHLKMLYSMGRADELALWLKIVCDAREKDYTPEEVIYSFYDYLEEDEKPDFVKEILENKPVKKRTLFSFFKW